MKRLFLILLLAWGAGEVLAQGADSAMTADTVAGAVTAGEADSVTNPAEETSEPVGEATPDALWDRANTAYLNGDYHAATSIYEEILSRGLSSMKLYYNLGNSCFKEGRLGEAILYYNRALRLAPGNDDIRYNLRVAESRTKDSIEEIPEFFLTGWLRTLRHAMSCTAWSIFSLVALAAALGLFLLYLLARRLSLRKTGFYGTMIAVLLCIVTTWCAAGERREMLDDTQAVVMSLSTAVKSSPDKSATDLFVLHEGTRVEITNRLEGWCEITIADGKKGWLESKNIETI